MFVVLSYKPDYTTGCHCHPDQHDGDLEIVQHDTVPEVIQYIAARFLEDKHEPRYVTYVMTRWEDVVQIAQGSISSSANERGNESNVAEIEVPGAGYYANEEDAPEVHQERQALQIQIQKGVLDELERRAGIHKANEAKALAAKQEAEARAREAKDKAEFERLKNKFEAEKGGGA